MNSSFVLTIYFHPLPCFFLMVPSTSVFCNNLCKCPLLVGKCYDMLLTPYPFSSLDTLIKMWSFTENTMFIVYSIASTNVTEWLQSVLETEIFYHRYFKIDESAIRQCFNEILCIFHRMLHEIRIGWVQISRWCVTLCWVYFFRTQCFRHDGTWYYTMRQ